MTILKSLNHLVLIENVLSIYRNYCNQTKIKKCFIILQIFLQTIYHVISLTTELSFVARFHLKELFFIVITSFANYSSSVVTGICYSRAFMSYYRSITRVSELFEMDKDLIKALKKVYCFSIFLILFAIGITFYRSTDTFKGSSGAHISILVLFFVSQTLLRFTVILEYLMFFVVVMILFNLIKCLSSMISVIPENIVRCEICFDEHHHFTREDIQKWVELYRDLSNCCKKVMQCFGHQFSLSLIITITHFINMTYQSIYFSVVNGGGIGISKKSVFFGITYITFLMMPIVAGQLTHNQAAKCHRVLARLYNTMITDSNEPNLKLIKDFLRLMKNNPIEIKLSSKIPIGVYILPLIFTFTINYVIIMLQFNNVV